MGYFYANPSVDEELPFGRPLAGIALIQQYNAHPEEVRFLCLEEDPK